MRAGNCPPDRYQLKSFKYSSHYWILKLLLGEKGPLRILDVGASSGYLGSALREQGHYVVGIEKDEETAEKARAFYDSFHVRDIEEFEFPFHAEFDFIIYGDILEHLRDPAAVLQRSLPALRKSGRIIVSVPNVANLVIRLGLLLGRFEYADRGILDRTHLRFFTLQSVKKMLREASCSIDEIVPTPLPIQIVFPLTEKRIFTPLHEVHYALVRLWKAMFAYQFVVKATTPYLKFDRFLVEGGSNGQLTNNCHYAAS